jgi:hypothetical protein
MRGTKTYLYVYSYSSSTGATAEGFVPFLGVGATAGGMAGRLFDVGATAGGIGGLRL